jgi:glycosyltransferase involved in cell wall biosynthesis
MENCGAMNLAPFLSVVICTRDRAASLQRTLASLVVAARTMTHPWELLVVDNGSSDNTADVVASFADRLPIRCVREDKAGLSNARNAGVREGRGQYFVWTDDDVTVDPGWLQAWASGIAAAPDYAVFGGRAVPVYEEPVQQWFAANEQDLAALLAIRDERDWTVLDFAHVPYGLNYAIRAAEQRSHPYDPALGVAPGRRLGGEEVAVIRAILRQGGRGAWVWDATVHHMIPASRQSVSYVRQFYRALGFYLASQGPGGLIARGRGALLAALAWTVSKCRLGRVDEGRAPVDVRSLVRLARAEGSLRRHLGLKLD